MKIAGCDLSMNGSGVCVMDLDEDLNCVSTDWLGFAYVKKNAPEDQRNTHVIYYKQDWYRSRYDLTEMMIINIMDKLRGCSFVAIEDYAISACGMLADIGEFVGQVCYEIWKSGIALKKYVPQHAKIRLTDYGNTDKIGMYFGFVGVNGIKPDLTGYPVPEDSDGVSPTSDIIDAYALCELLRTELAIRSGKLDINSDPIAKKIFGNGKVFGNPFILRRTSS